MERKLHRFILRLFYLLRIVRNFISQFDSSWLIVFFGSFSFERLDLFLLALICFILIVRKYICVIVGREKYCQARNEFTAGRIFGYWIGLNRQLV